MAMSEIATAKNIVLDRIIAHAARNKIDDHSGHRDAIDLQPVAQ
jgi:hypothetical protein